MERHDITGSNGGLYSTQIVDDIKKMTILIPRIGRLNSQPYSSFKIPLVFSNHIYKNVTFLRNVMKFIILRIRLLIQRKCEKPRNIFDYLRILHVLNVRRKHSRIVEGLYQRKFILKEDQAFSLSLELGQR